VSRRESARRAVPEQDLRLSADTIVFRLEGRTLQALLVRRPVAPFAGARALPGGFVRDGESLEDAAARVLETETGLRDVYLEQLYTFGDPARDPRGRVVTVAYIALVRPGGPAPREGAEWVGMTGLPALAFDHRPILDYALQRLRYKLEYTPVGFRLLPEEFSLSQVQTAYEAILGRALDKRNFRKKLLSLKVLKPLARTARDGAHRPARLYRFEPGRWEALKEKGNVFVF
jgi:8-oxo-dGTP diphosphatase